MVFNFLYAEFIEENVTAVVSYSRLLFTCRSNNDLPGFLGRNENEFSVSYITSFLTTVHECQNTYIWSISST